MYFIVKCNVSKLLAPVVIRKKLMTVCMLPLAGRMRTLCNLRLQCLPYEKYVFSAVPFLCMIFAEITFCFSINLEQPVMVLVVFFLTYQLSCGMRYLILSVPMSLLILKENPGPHFVQRLFFLMNISFGICCIESWR